ncbi:MAG: hypothetical protein ACLQIB_28275 [Isosphaeraceae bacterium]
MATLEAVREALRAQPFEPFDLKLVDGRHFTITHPDFLAIPLPPPHRVREILLFTLGDYGPGTYRTHRIDLGLIVEVTSPSDATAPPPAAPTQ